MEGMEGSPPAALREVDESEAKRNARLLLDPDGAWKGKLDLAGLAAACAELGVEVDGAVAEVDHLKSHLQEALRELKARFDAQGVDQVRVATSDGRKLAYLHGVHTVTVKAEDRERVRAWLAAHAPAEVAQTFVETFQAAHFQSIVKQAEQDGEGVYPTELVEAGVVKVFKDRVVRFRKA